MSIWGEMEYASIKDEQKFQKKYKKDHILWNSSGLSRSPWFWILAGYFIFLFVTVLIRSIISGITFDEAYTYIHFGRINLFDINTIKSLYGGENCIANNHWLNSFLIHICNRVIHAEYNEFLIRLPSLMFFVLYLIGTGYGYCRRLLSFTAAVFLVSSYYLLEFYGLARGYGMANTCVFFACLAYRMWMVSEYREMKHLNWLMVYLSLGVFSNTIVLLLYPAIGMICLVHICRTKAIASFLRRCSILFIGFFAFALLMAKYHMNISAEGKPLYTGGGQSFYTSVVEGYARMLVSDQEPIIRLFLILLLIGVILSIILLGKEYLKQDYFHMLIIFVATNILMQMVLHKGYIATRVLVPFYAFIVMSFYGLFSAAADKLKAYLPQGAGVSLKILPVLVSGLLMLSVVIRTDLYSTEDWSDEYKFKTWVLGSKLTGQQYDEYGKSYAEIFYDQKYQNIQERYLSEIQETDHNS